MGRKLFSAREVRLFRALAFSHNLNLRVNYFRLVMQRTARAKCILWSLP